MTICLRRIDFRTGGVFASCYLLLACAAGCQTGAIRAARLPGEFRCPPNVHSHVISVAGVTGPGINSSLIGSGDLLSITVTSGIEGEEPQPRLARVAPDGRVEVPQVGPVRVAELEPFEASQNVTAVAVQRGIYVDPHVVVEVQKRAANRVTVVGEVESPGVHEIPRSSSELLTAIAAAGGFTEEASTVVEIVRHPPAASPAVAERSPEGVQLAAYQSPFAPPPAEASPYRIAEAPNVQGALPPVRQPSTTKIDLGNHDQSLQSDHELGDGDVIHVLPKEKRFIHVTGLVYEAGQFELPPNQDVRLLDAIAMAGGKKNPVADKVLVIRHVEDQPEPIVIRANLSTAKRNGRENLLLQSGDMVSVEQTASTLVVDTLTNFLRFSVGLAGRTTTF